MAENFLAVNYVRYEKDDSKSARFLATPNPTSPPNPLLLNVCTASAFWLVEEGVHLLSVRDVLGHSTTEMTERYAHMDSQRIHDAVAVLDGSRSQSSHTG